MKAKKSADERLRVVVIGGGLMGTAAALELARAGADVTVLEKAIPGAEASTAAAGILGAEVENEEPGPMLELCRRSRKLYPGWVDAVRRATAIDPGLLEGGSLRVARDAAEREKLTARHAFQLGSGAARLLGAAEARDLEPNLGKCDSALFFETDARITPKLLFRAVQLAAIGAGVRFRAGAIVRRVLTEADGERRRVTGVALEGTEPVMADRVVVAAGSWTSLVEGLPANQAPVIPARGQLVELYSERVPLRRLVFGRGIYLIPRADGHTLVGSTLEFVGFKKAVTAKGMSDLLSSAIDLVPELGESEVTASWSNFRPYTKDQLPLLGSPGIDGLVIASGHYRNGILLAPVTAELVAALCLGRKPSLDLAPFSPIRGAGDGPPHRAAKVP